TEYRRVAVDPPPAPQPPAKPKKETAAERKKRLAEEKRMERILKALDSKNVGLVGLLGTDTSLGLGSLKGTGSGFGVGVGVGAGPPPANDREAVHRVVEAHKGAVKYCYEKELAAKPDLAGRVTVRFTIDGTGAVTEVTVPDSTLGDTAVEE